MVLWILIFAIFFFAGLCLRKPFSTKIETGEILGAFSGLWLLLLGLFTIGEGIQTEVGVNITQVNDTALNIVYQNADLVLPFSTYAIIWGLSLILISVYIVYDNIMS